MSAPEIELVACDCGHTVPEDEAVELSYRVSEDEWETDGSSCRPCLDAEEAAAREAAYRAEEEFWASPAGAAEMARAIAIDEADAAADTERDA